LYYFSILLVSLLPAFALARQSQPGTSSDAALKTFLQSYLNDPKFGSDHTARIAYATIPVSAGGGTFVVYVAGQTWCGSGGCMLFVLEPNDDSFRVIGRTSAVQLPVRILDTSNARHPDLAVWVEGGGITKGYEARLRFNGQRYPAIRQRPRLPGRDMRSKAGLSSTKNPTGFPCTSGKLFGHGPWPIRCCTSTYCPALCSVEMSP
jgi:hypothetical protein